jgi:hypothetical protein
VRQFVLIDIDIASATLRSNRPRPISDMTEVGTNRPSCLHAEIAERPLASGATRLMVIDDQEVF